MSQSTAQRDSVIVVDQAELALARRTVFVDDFGFVTLTVADDRAAGDDHEQRIDQGGEEDA